MLFCALDIGGRMETYSSYLKKKYPLHEYKTFSKSQVDKKHYHSHYDYQFNYHRRSRIEQYLISLLFFIYTLYRFDIIYIISGENILTRKLLRFELATYKFFGKKIIMNFVGADIRNPDHTRMESLKLTEDAKLIQEVEIQKPFQERLCRLAELYADEILVVSPDLIKFFKKTVKFVPVFIEVEQFQNELKKHGGGDKENSDLPIILHAPSNPMIKGTPYIKKLFDKLEPKKKFKFILTTEPEYNSQIDPPYTVSKYDILKYFSISDLVIDQLTIGWYGMQSIEAILAGAKVICLIDEDLTEYLPSGHTLSVIHEAKDLESKLKTIWFDDLVEESKDHSWVNKFHNIDKNPSIQDIFKTYLGNE